MNRSHMPFVCVDFSFLIRMVDQNVEFDGAEASILISGERKRREGVDFE